MRGKDIKAAAAEQPELEEATQADRKANGPRRLQRERKAKEEADRKASTICLTLMMMNKNTMKIHI